MRLPWETSESGMDIMLEGQDAAYVVRVEKMYEAARIQMKAIRTLSKEMRTGDARTVTSRIGMQYIEEPDGNIEGLQQLFKTTARFGIQASEQNTAGVSLGGDPALSNPAPTTPLSALDANPIFAVLSDFDNLDETIPLLVETTIRINGQRIALSRSPDVLRALEVAGNKGRATEAAEGRAKTKEDRLEKAREDRLDALKAARAKEQGKSGSKEKLAKEAATDREIFELERETERDRRVASGESSRFGEKGSEFVSDVIDVGATAFRGLGQIGGAVGRGVGAAGQFVGGAAVSAAKEFQSESPASRDIPVGGGLGHLIGRREKILAADKAKQKKPKSKEANKDAEKTRALTRGSKDIGKTKGPEKNRAMELLSIHKDDFSDEEMNMFKTLIRNGVLDATDIAKEITKRGQRSQLLQIS